MEIDELYQEVILDHFKRPRCRGCIDKPSASLTLHNPLCGDQVELSVSVSKGRIVEIAFGGHGCSISQASASMMSELCKGKTLEEIRKIGDSFKQMMRGEQPGDALVTILGDAVALEGVRKFSARVKCAMLAWEAIEKCMLEAQAQDAQANGALSHQIPGQKTNEEH